MNWQVKISNSVYKNLKKFPKKDREKIKLALYEFVFSPFNGDIEKMKGSENSWRRRIGSYRVFYDVYKNLKIVELVSKGDGLYYIAPCCLYTMKYHDR